MRQLLTFWTFNISSLVLFGMILFIFIVLKANRKPAFLALFLLVICLFSPVQLLSAQYLFSAHMVVHVALLLCIGPLIVMAFRQESKRFEALFLLLKEHPLTSWITGIGIMWFWHIPLVFNSTMSAMHHGTSALMNLAEASSLVFAGMVFSAPVIHPNKEYRIDSLSGVVYLFTACIGCSLLGLLITFAPAGTYHHFLAMHDPYSLNTLITADWGMTQSIDQQAAGLIMWVPCCLIYVSGAMYLLVHWFKEKENIISYPKEL